MAKMTEMKNTFGIVLDEMLDAGKPIMVVDIDMCRLTWTGPVGEKHPGAFVQVGIAEQNAVGVSAGLASMGYTVFVTTIASFMSTRASDQALNTVCYNELDVKLCGSYAGMTGGINGGTHMSMQDTAAFRAMPGMRVADPADGFEFAAMVKAVADTPGPVYLRVPRGSMPDLFERDPGFEWGRGQLLNDGGDVTLVTSGVITYQGAGAVRLLAESGMKVRHIHMGSVKPLDEKMLLDAAEKSRLIVTAENHSVIGGLGAAVCEFLSDKRPMHVVRLGVNDEFCEGIEAPDLMKRHGLDAEGLAAGIRRVAAH